MTLNTWVHANRLIQNKSHRNLVTSFELKCHQGTLSFTNLTFTQHSDMIAPDVEIIDWQCPTCFLALWLKSQIIESNIKDNLWELWYISSALMKIPAFTASIVLCYENLLFWRHMHWTCCVICDSCHLGKRKCAVTQNWTSAEGKLKLHKPSVDTEKLFDLLFHLAKIMYMFLRIEFLRFLTERDVSFRLGTTLV